MKPNDQASGEQTFEDSASQGKHEPDRLGPYQLLAKLGQGGMGTVYKALHTRLDKVVALKVVRPDRMNSPKNIQRFQREMKAVGKLDHPHIVRAMDAGEVDGTYYLAMEYLAGTDLAELLGRTGPLPIDVACELVRQAALGLEAAHSQGMVHRDIKPANLMLATAEFGPPLVKVLDLGLALLTDSSTTTTTEGSELTGAGIMGTIDYMAPEQADNSHSVDIRADVYSLGATLYALLSGGSIFQGRTFAGMIQKLSALATEPARPIREHRKNIPDRLANIVHNTLSLDPSKRYSTPANLASALEPFGSGATLTGLLPAKETVNTQPVTSPSLEAGTVTDSPISAEVPTGTKSGQPATSPQTVPFSDSSPRKRWGLVVGVTGVILLCVLGILFLVRDRPERDSVNGKAPRPSAPKHQPRVPVVVERLQMKGTKIPKGFECIRNHLLEVGDEPLDPVERLELQQRRRAHGFLFPDPHKFIYTMGPFPPDRVPQGVKTAKSLEVQAVALVVERIDPGGTLIGETNDFQTPGQLTIRTRRKATMPIELVLFLYPLSEVSARSLDTMSPEQALHLEQE